MNPQQIQAGSKNIRRTIGPSWKWVGAGLAIVGGLALALAALAIRGGVSPAATRPVADKAPKPVAQSVPSAADQGVQGYLRAHGAGQADTAPDAARRSQLDQLHGQAAGQPIQAQSVPDAAAQGVAAYLRAHDDPSFHAPKVAVPGQPPAVQVRPAVGALHGAACNDAPTPARNCPAQTAPGNAEYRNGVCDGSPRPPNVLAGQAGASGRGRHSEECDGMPFTVQH